MAERDGPVDDAETELWDQTVKALLANGSTPTEAFDGANLVLRAYRRKREEPAGDHGRRS
jgi:hypothetical protein